MIEACIGLGANLGDPHRALVDAAAALQTLPRTRLTGRSPIYRSAPVGPGAQAPYLNAVVRLETELGPRDLLHALQRIEDAAGRVRRERWGPRTLDLDLLTYGDEARREDDLTLPHPRIGERNFVLVPLIDVLGPDAVVQGRTLRTWLAQAPANALEATALAWAAPKRDCA